MQIEETFICRSASETQQKEFEANPSEVYEYDTLTIIGNDYYTYEDGRFLVLRAIGDGENIVSVHLNKDDVESIITILTYWKENF